MKYIKCKSSPPRQSTPDRRNPEKMSNAFLLINQTTTGSETLLLLFLLYLLKRARLSWYYDLFQKESFCCLFSFLFSFLFPLLLSFFPKARFGVIQNILLWCDHIHSALTPPVIFFLFKQRLVLIRSNILMFRLGKLSCCLWVISRAQISGSFFLGS